MLLGQRPTLAVYIELGPGGSHLHTRSFVVPSSSLGNQLARWQEFRLAGRLLHRKQTGSALDTRSVLFEIRQTRLTALFTDAVDSVNVFAFHRLGGEGTVTSR